MKKIFCEERIEIIAEKTDFNDHIGAMLTVTSQFDEKILYDMIKYLESRWENLGYLNEELSLLKRKLYEEMIEVLKDEFSNWKDVNGAL